MLRDDWDEASPPVPSAAVPTFFIDTSDGNAPAGASATAPSASRSLLHLDANMLVSPETPRSAESIRSRSTTTRSRATSINSFYSAAETLGQLPTPPLSSTASTSPQPQAPSQSVPSGTLVSTYARPAPSVASKRSGKVRALFASCLPYSALHKPIHSMRILFSSVLLMRFEHPREIIAARKSHADLENIFWREYYAFLVLDLATRDTHLHFCGVENNRPDKPIESIALRRTRLELHTPSDGAFVLQSAASPTKWVCHASSVDLAILWYRAIWLALPENNRVPAPPTVRVSIPDVHLAVAVPLDPEMTVWTCRDEAVEVVREAAAAAPDDAMLVGWLAHVDAGAVAVCWRRGDRIEWIDEACRTGISAAFGPRTLENTHQLELRIMPDLVLDTREIPPPFYAEPPNPCPPALCEGFLSRRVRHHVLGIYSWETYFCMQISDDCLWFTRFPTSHIAAVAAAAAAANSDATISAASAGSAPATASLEDAAYRISAVPLHEERTVLTGRQFLYLADLSYISIPEPCLDCASALAKYTTIGSAAHHGTPLVSLPTRASTTAATHLRGRSAQFHLVMTNGDVAELAADGHPALHAWLAGIADAVIHLRQQRYTWGQHFRHVLETNAATYARGPRFDAADLVQSMVTDARLWPVELTSGDVAIKAAHPVYFKRKSRGLFKPAFLIVTEARVLLCKRADAGSGMYVVRHAIALHARSHVLVGYVNPKTGAAAADEESHVIDPKLFTWASAAPLPAPPLAPDAGDEMLTDSDDEDDEFGAGAREDGSSNAGRSARGGPRGLSNVHRARLGLSQPDLWESFHHAADAGPSAAVYADIASNSVPIVPFSSAELLPEPHLPPPPPLHAHAANRVLHHHHLLNHGHREFGAPASEFLAPSAHGPARGSRPAASKDEATGNLATWLPPLSPPIVTQHEGPHQVCLTLWSPPSAADLVKRRRRRGKVIVVHCQRKVERDQLLLALQAIIARKVAAAMAEEARQ
ncbi:hypothetical protein H9P43_004655 [Blastocladiella emersonii ATCC 22665]|nr:hypothetical protein H9P43_004655 [Blastocladiella emersonii ATCC 22665]